MRRAPTRNRASATRGRLVGALAVLLASLLMWTVTHVAAPLTGVHGLARDRYGVEPLEPPEPPGAARLGSSLDAAARVAAETLSPRSSDLRVEDGDRAASSSTALRVHVVDAVSGAAVECFTLAWRPAGENHALGPFADTVKVQHSEGRGERRGLRPGRYDLCIDPTAAGYERVAIEGVALPAAAELVVRVGRGAHCEGRLRGAGGEAIAGACVRLERLDSEAPWCTTRTSGADGEYLFTMLEPGCYRLTRPDIEGAPAAVVEVARGTGARVDLAPADTCVLDLTVVGEAGEPLACASVLIASPGGGRRRAITGPDGRVSIAGLPPGVSAVRVTSSGRDPGACSARLTWPHAARVRMRLARQR